MNIQIMFGIKMVKSNNAHKEQIVIILFQKRLLLNLTIMNVKKILVLILTTSMINNLTKIQYHVLNHVIMFITIINTKNRIIKYVQINNHVI